MLFDHQRLERVAATIDREAAGVWPDRIGVLSDTAYLCTADSRGTSVSIIQSNYRGIGSPFGAANSGFMLQDRGGGFGLVPGHPNELGPNKRPLHTLAPTLWTENSTARWIIGTRGGPIQPQLVAQVAALTILHGQEPDRAQAAPRWAISDFGPQSGPSLRMEPGVATNVIEELTRRGHQITTLDEAQRGWGPMSIIGRDDGVTVASADPRVDTATALVFNP